MRVLLLHPEDSPRLGPWTEQQWDLVVDLGKSSRFSEAAWAERLHCRLLRAESFRRGVEDVKMVRELFAAGRGRLLDEEGIDWWDLTSLAIAPEAEAVLVLQRLGSEISPSAELWATRPGWPASALAWLLRLPLHSFSDSTMTKLIAQARLYGGVFHRFSARQIKQIFLDKYDSGYKWRSRFASSGRVLPEPVVLLPSAYGNVSRMAFSYARLLPERSFLLVATRQSAKEFEPPPNVQVRDLASYANTEPPLGEIASILERWKTVENELRVAPEFDVLSKAGVFRLFRGWFRDCLCARNAWREVLDREPVSAVLCGDDSNIYTRLPVMLASKRKIPTLDFHHGAMDGRYLLKDLTCDLYMAKNEMERDYLLRVCELPSDRVAMGAPITGGIGSLPYDSPPVQRLIVLFSEPYENAMMRAEEVYRELLPQLCRVARNEGRRLVIKLHPFESAPERKKLVRALLTDEDHSLVTVIDGPLSEQLLSQTWFGITGESTTIMDCLLQGIPCFLMGWLRLSSYGYVEQYARFGLGEVVESVDDVPDLPRRLEEFRYPDATQAWWKMVDVDLLQQWLGVSATVPTSVSRVS